ncbi:30S ribosomal protein S11 [Glugoides intestinalis]
MAEIINKNKLFPRQMQVDIDPYPTAEKIAATRFYKEIGKGYTVPETAINAIYIDKKCPFTGEVYVRGHIFKGKVIKMKAEKTIVVRMDYLHYDTKYKRFSRRNSKINVHLSPCFVGLVSLGDTVVCGETRPLSKTKAAVVISVEKADNSKKFKTFRKF